MTRRNAAEKNLWCGLVAALWTGLLISVGSPAHGQEDPPGLKRPNGIVAIVNWEAITHLDLEEAFAPVAREIRKQVPPGILEKRLQRARREVLDLLIDNRLLLQRCDEEKIEVTDGNMARYVEFQLKEARRKGHQIQNEAEYYRLRCEEAGESPEEIREKLTEDIRIQLLFERKVFSDPYISPEELRAYYNANPEEFSTNPEYVFRHIFLPRSELYIGELHERLQKDIENGVDFIKLVEVYSQGPRQDEGGIWRLNDKQLNDFILPFQVIRSLVIGETSGPHQTAAGIHYVYLEERIAGEQLAFEDAQRRIEKRIQRERRTLQSRRFGKELRRNAYVRVYLNDQDDPEKLRR